MAGSGGSADPGAHPLNEGRGVSPGDTVAGDEGQEAIGTDERSTKAGA